MSYETLAEYAESNVAFVSFDTDRSYQRSNPLPKMHSFPFVGTDIYAIRASRFVPSTAKGPAGGDNGASAAADAGPSLDSVKFFETSSLTIKPSAERVGDPKSLLDEIGEGGNKRLRSILEECESMSGNPEKIVVLSSVSGVHELKSSTAEFGILREWIDKGETAEYVKKKPRLESTLAEMERRRKGR